MNDDLLHVLQRRMLTHLLLKREHVLIHRACEHTNTVRNFTKIHLESRNTTHWLQCTGLTVSGGAPRRELPEHEAESVHVDTQEGVALEVDGALQDFWSHVAPRSHLQRRKGDSMRGQRSGTSSSKENFITEKWRSSNQNCESVPVTWLDHFTTKTTRVKYKPWGKISEEMGTSGNYINLLTLTDDSQDSSILPSKNRTKQFPFMTVFWPKSPPIPDSAQVPPRLHIPANKHTKSGTMTTTFMSSVWVVVPVHVCLLLISLLQTAGRGQSQRCRPSGCSSTAHSCS